MSRRCRSWFHPAPERQRGDLDDRATRSIAEGADEDRWPPFPIAPLLPLTVSFFRMDTDEQVAEIAVDAPRDGQLAAVQVPGIGPELGVAVRVEIHCRAWKEHVMEARRLKQPLRSDQSLRVLATRAGGP